MNASQITREIHKSESPTEEGGQCCKRSKQFVKGARNSVVKDSLEISCGLNASQITREIHKRGRKVL